MGPNYQTEPIILQELTAHTGINTQTNVWGELDGIFAVSGFNNGVENVMQIGGATVDQTGMTVLQAVTAIKAAGGRALVVLQNLNRTSWWEYIGMEM